jgi:hypothetical protein
MTELSVTYLFCMRGLMLVGNSVICITFIALCEIMKSMMGCSLYGRERKGVQDFGCNTSWKAAFEREEEAGP